MANAHWQMKMAAKWSTPAVITAEVTASPKSENTKLISSQHPYREVGRLACRGRRTACFMISAIVLSTSMPSRMWPADKGDRRPMSRFTRFAFLAAPARSPPCCLLIGVESPGGVISRAVTGSWICCLGCNGLSDIMRTVACNPHRIRHKFAFVAMLSSAWAAGKC